MATTRSAYLYRVKPAASIDLRRAVCVQRNGRRHNDEKGNQIRDKLANPRIDGDVREIIFARRNTATIMRSLSRLNDTVGINVEFPRSGLIKR